MNRISASALDLMASALAAIMLLYIVTLQEILLFEKSIEEKSSVLVHLHMNQEDLGKCKIGVFLEKENNSFFPHHRSDDITIQPTHFGERNYTLQIAVKNGKPIFDFIVVSLHTCEGEQPNIQRISIDIVGALATPRFQVTLSPKNVWAKLDLNQIRAGLTKSAWLPYQ